MKEIVFLNKNEERWSSFEKILDNHHEAEPDSVADMFIQLTDDLAYSRTYFPFSNTTKYLNFLVLKAHQVIYKNKTEKSSRIFSFWIVEFPMLINQNRKYIMYSFVAFTIALLVGIVSAANDATFVRLILGDSYVNMTIENIEKGDPMAVYKEMNQVNMFLGITINNIKVSFVAFVLGIFTSIGTIIILFMNGVMLGSFQYFFYEHDLLYSSVLTIWIHGTLEIWAIIVSGGAGITMGNSILFPGTFSRLKSFKVGVRKGVKMVIGLVPIFIMAGFLEGFVTRFTNMPEILSISIIVLLLIFIIWYFFIYPSKFSTKIHDHGYHKLVVKNKSTY